MSSVLQIDSNAPVIVRSTIEIESTPDNVWNIMSDLENWPRWNPEIRSVRLAGPFAEGTEFKWKAGPGTIRSRLTAIEKPGTLGWTGITFGIRAVHVWGIRSIDGKTLVTTEESWDGVHVRLFRKHFSKMLEKSIRTGLRYLKAEAEKGLHGRSRA